MEADVFLCNAAEAAEGKLYVNGAGINVCYVPAEPPHMINVALGAVIEVPYTATNQPHTLIVTLLDSDGNQVRPWTPDESEVPPVEVHIPFNLGRPPGLQPGDAQTMPVALNVQL